VQQTLGKLYKECACRVTPSHRIPGGVAHLVERLLRMHEARGSKPRTSISHGRADFLKATLTYRQEGDNIFAKCFDLAR
jgi:hypothetical protein